MTTNSFSLMNYKIKKYIKFNIKNFIFFTLPYYFVTMVIFLSFHIPSSLISRAIFAKNIYDFEQHYFIRFIKYLNTKY